MEVYLFYLFFLRWIHFLSGITWIGLLYYFNFVQTPFFAETEASVRSAAVQKLVPRALWWFRWGAMFTFLAGIVIYIHKLTDTGGSLFYASPYGLAITTGGLMGTLMFLNVWLVIWPKQKVVIASAAQVAQGGQAIPGATACARRAALASRTNTLFSIPMLFFMGAASHYPAIVGKTSEGSLTWFWIISLVIIGAVELNALVGTQGSTKRPLDSVSGTIWAGFILAAILYLLFLILF
ncbi:MAG: urate hydroxylase PuuD [Candidatus Binatia bacterium]